MQHGMQLVELAQKLANEATQKRDLIVNTNQVQMTTVDKEVEMLTEHGQFPLRPLAHQQIADRLDIPAKYYKRMQADAPVLLANNINTWFCKNPELRMVRTIKPNGIAYGRAFLSNRYMRVENDLVANVALKALIAAGMKIDQVISCNVTDTKLYIQATLPHLEGEVKSARKVGDLIRGGVVITNSEVGKGSFAVSEFDYRLVCLNGMIGQSLFKKTHLGGSIVDNEDLLRDDTKRTLDSALMLQLRDMIGAACDPDRFHARIDRMSALAGAEISGNLQESVKMLTRVLPEVALTDKDEDNILKALVKGGDVSAWGLVNAMTFQANAEQDYDRAVEFEAAGGKLLNLPKSEWNRILEAA